MLCLLHSACSVGTTSCQSVPYTGSGIKSARVEVNDIEAPLVCRHRHIPAGGAGQPLVQALRRAGLPRPHGAIPRAGGHGQRPGGALQPLRLLSSHAVRVLHCTSGMVRVQHTVSAAAWRADRQAAVRCHGLSLASLPLNSDYHRLCGYMHVLGADDQTLWLLKVQGCCCNRCACRSRSHTWTWAGRGPSAARRCWRATILTSMGRHGLHVPALTRLFHLQSRKD